MGHIYRDREPFPFSNYEFFYTDSSSNRVYTIVNKKSDDKKNPPRIMVGKIVPGNTNLMFVNDNFKKFFPELWKEYYSADECLKNTLFIGCYILILVLASRTKLYEMLIKVFGVFYANAILDICMYSIIFRDNVVSASADRMINNVLFSYIAYSAAWYTSFFENDEVQEKIAKFKELWLNLKLSNRKLKVVLGVDGSNTDCSAESCDYAQKGHAKSKNNSKIVAYMWIIDVETGDPLTYFVKPGDKPDCKIFLDVIEYLKNYNIVIDCVLMDRNFCNSDILTSLQTLSIPCVVMVPSNVFCHKKMLEKYYDNINKDPNNLIGDGHLYGVTEEMHIFHDSNLSGFINLYYHDTNGAERRETFNCKLKNEYDRIKKLIADNKNKNDTKNYKKIKVNEEFKNCIIYDEEKNEVYYNIDGYIETICSKGFYSIITSQNYGADRTHELYSLRNVCEEEYNIIKNQLGYDALRGHSKKVILFKFFICFCCTILRNEIHKIAIKLKCDVNKIIRKMQSLEVNNINNHYKIVKDASTFQKNILRELGIDDDVLNYIESMINSWENGRAPKGYQHPDLGEIKKDEKKVKRGHKKKYSTQSESLVSHKDAEQGTEQTSAVDPSEDIGQSTEQTSAVDSSEDIGQSTGQTSAVDSSEGIGQSTEQTSAEDPSEDVGLFTEQASAVDPSEGMGRSTEQASTEDPSESIGRSTEHTSAVDPSGDVGQSTEQSSAEDPSEDVGQSTEQASAEDPSEGIGRSTEHTSAVDPSEDVGLFTEQASAVDPSEGIGRSTEQTSAAISLRDANSSLDSHENTVIPTLFPD